MPATTEKTYVGFASKPPHGTLFLNIEAPLGTDLTDMLTDLAATGWTQVYRDTPPFPALTDAGTPAGYDAVEISVCAPGTGLFTGWTEPEAIRFETAAREILASYGFEDIPTWRMEWHDCV